METLLDEADEHGSSHSSKKKQENGNGDDGASAPVTLSHIDLRIKKGELVAIIGMDCFWSLFELTFFLD